MGCDATTVDDDHVETEYFITLHFLWGVLNQNSVVAVVTGCSFLIFSTTEALKEAKRRQRELELEFKQVMRTVLEQNEEEIKRVREWLKEYQERQLAEVKASKRILRCVCKKIYIFNFFLKNLC